MTGSNFTIINNIKNIVVANFVIDKTFIAHVYVKLNFVKTTVCFVFLKVKPLQLPHAEIHISNYDIENEEDLLVMGNSKNIPT